MNCLMPWQDLHGEDVTPALMQQRKSLLLDTFNALSPDCVITETFPVRPAPGPG
jgi:predicted glycosyltransferase